MNNNLTNQLLHVAIKILERGGIIAYPTEGVYGLSCDPLNPHAVKRLLDIKQRDVKKGLILIAESWTQLLPYTAPIPEDKLQVVLATWPGPYTWIFPAKEFTPDWIKGEHDSVAIRVSDYPIIKQLCRAFKGPLISTSANLQGQAAATSYKEVCTQFEDQLDLIIQGNVGPLNKPTSIRNALTGEVLRI